MAYVDGFVIPVKTAKREEYKKMALELLEVYKEHGAISITECWGDDVPDGKVTSFPMAVKCEPDETVVFSWVLWESKEARTAGLEKVMADPRMQPEGEMPFDGKRLIYGGFETLY